MGGRSHVVPSPLSRSFRSRVCLSGLLAAFRRFFQFDDDELVLTGFVCVTLTDDTSARGRAVYEARVD